MRHFENNPNPAYGDSAKVAVTEIEGKTEGFYVVLRPRRACKTVMINEEEMTFLVDVGEDGWPVAIEFHPDPGSARKEAMKKLDEMRASEGGAASEGGGR